MRKIDRAGFERLLANARVIEADRFGPKVAVAENGNYIKIFRRKRWLSTAVLYPYARRFCRNARRLPQLGIETVTVEGICACPALGRHLVFYRPLAGETLRQLLATGKNRQRLLSALAAYIAQLHRHGVLFRSLHFGNLLRLPTGGFGLIDIADLTISPRPLTAGQRWRNFRHLLSRPEEREVITAFGREKFFHLYLEHSGLTPAAREKLAARLLADWPPAGKE